MDKVKKQYLFANKISQACIIVIDKTQSLYIHDRDFTIQKFGWLRTKKWSNVAIVIDYVKSALFFILLIKFLIFERENS